MYGESYGRASEDGNATSSVGAAQGTGNRYGVQGDGGGVDTCLIYMALSPGTDVGPTEVTIMKVDNRNDEFRTRFDSSATNKVKQFRAYWKYDRSPRDTRLLLPSKHKGKAFSLSICPFIPTPRHLSSSINCMLCYNTNTEDILFSSKRLCFGKSCSLFALYGCLSLNKADR